MIESKQLRHQQQKQLRSDVFIVGNTVIPIKSFQTEKRKNGIFVLPLTGCVWFGRMVGRS